MPASRDLASLAAAVVLVLGGFGSPGVRAQGLPEIFAAARSYDASYLGARSTADAARYRYEQSRAAYLPSASLGLTAGRSASETPFVPQQTHAATNSSGASINAAQTIFNRQNDLQVDEAQKYVDIAQSQLAQAEQDLLVRVAQAYFNVLTSTATLQTVQANCKAIAEQLASARRNFDLGNATITDSREAEARSDLAHAQEIAADNDLQLARIALDQLVGRHGVVAHPIALPVTLPPLMPSQPADWLTLGESDSPALQQARLGLEIAQLETRRARAGHLPTVIANASYGRGHEHEWLRGQLGGTYSGTAVTSEVSVTLTVPLFAGFAIENRVRETVALEDKARTDAEGARNNVTLGTRQAFLGAQSLGAQVKALEAAEISSKLALDATLLGYKVGVKVNLDVLNAQSQLFQTQRDLAATRYNYLLATLKLRQATGTLTANDLLAVDALLVP